MTQRVLLTCGGSCRSGEAEQHLVPLWKSTCITFVCGSSVLPESLVRERDLCFGESWSKYEVAILRRTRLAGSSEDAISCLTSSTRFSYINGEHDGQPAILLATWHTALVSAAIMYCTPLDLDQRVCGDGHFSGLQILQSLLLSNERSSSHAVDILRA
jgi:hypothetical protein